MPNETIDATTRALQIAIKKRSDIADFFTQTTGQAFIDWFNDHCADQDAWVGRALGTSAAVRQRFNRIWEEFPTMFAADQINLVQFICLKSIFINEVGGDLLPITEKVGRENHPGLAYPFDTISKMVPAIVNKKPVPKEVLLKGSYNKKPLNKTAFELFNDDLYIKTHGHLALADRLKNTADQRWNTTTYPQDDFPTSTDAAVSGFIREADFFKFRGRGFIQTTWRANYILLIKFIQSYPGANATILRYKKKWAGQKPDDVATTSTNADWDELFQNSELIIPCASVRSHNLASGNYLSLFSDPDTIIGKDLGKGKELGAIYWMGLRISGGADYASLFKKRVIQILLTLHRQQQGTV